MTISRLDILRLDLQAVLARSGVLAGDQVAVLLRLAAERGAEVGAPAPDRPCRACPECGADMAGMRRDAVYCSDACRVAAWRRNVLNES